MYRVHCVCTVYMVCTVYTYMCICIVNAVCTTYIVYAVYNVYNIITNWFSKVNCFRRGSQIKLSMLCACKIHILGPDASSSNNNCRSVLHINR